MPYIPKCNRSCNHKSWGNKKQLKKTIIITRGENGSVAINNDEVIECKSNKNLKVIDLTGAGDLFAAGFINSYNNGLSIEESLQNGCVLAAKIIQQFGARLEKDE